MKILQVISSHLIENSGGDVNVCVNLSKEFAKAGHAVTIITTDFGFDSTYAGSVRSEGVHVISFPCVAKFGGGCFILSSIKIWLEKNLGC